MKNLYTKHKKKILVTLSAAALYLVAHFGLGLNVEISQVTDGHVSEIGKSIEEAPQ